jgi:hypothetical protein
MDCLQGRFFPKPIIYRKCVNTSGFLLAGVFYGVAVYKKNLRQHGQFPSLQFKVYLAVLKHF